MKLQKTGLTSSKDEELEAIAILRALPLGERQEEQMTRRAIAPLGHPLPVIHRVLFT